MDNLDQAFLDAVELHSADQLRSCLDAGLDLHMPIRGRLPIQWMTAMYTRSDELANCLKLLLDGGGQLDDPAIEPVLLDDAPSLREAIRSGRLSIGHHTTLESAFTPMEGASLLHVAAEFGNQNAARALVELGADVNARAATDEHGMGGHTPLFHTVNSNGNRAQPIMKLLLDAGARLDTQLAGVTWGKGFDWETTLFDVTPITYAQFGLLPQMHRNESDIYDNVRILLAAAGRHIPPLENIPNRYVRS